MPSRSRHDDDTSMGPSAKKSRVDFGVGSITRVTVKNFMTYGFAEFLPGSRLNLVLGPNGSGKSSLVSAICLGLAGTPKLLNRADNLRDFVLRGEKTGQIDIWVRSRNQTDVRITRELNRDKNTSDWRINGAQKLERDVKELIANLGIQLDNLCQFMPQDRVAEFARLKPRELLRETQRAIGDGSLCQKHEALIAERAEFAILERSTESGRAELKRMETLNDSLKRDVRRFEHKHELETQVAELRSKKIMLEIEEQQATCTRNENFLKQGEKHHQESIANAEKTAAPQKGKEKRAKTHEAKAKKAREYISKATKDIEDSQAAIQEKTEAMEEKLGEISSAEEDYRKLQEEIATANTKLDDAKQELSEYEAQGAQDLSSKEAELQGLTEQRVAKHSELGEIRTQIEDVRSQQAHKEHNYKLAKDALDRFQDVKEVKLKKLERIDKNIRRLVEWLAEPENRSRFRGQVVGPVLCEVEVENDLHCRFLEQVCSKNMWSRFVVEYPEDQDALFKACEGIKLSSGQPYRPNITCYNGNVTAPIQHPCGEASEFSRDYVENTLDQLFTAPPIIKHAMNDEAGLSTTFCSSNEAFNADAFLKKHKNISKVLTTTEMHSSKGSRYDRTINNITVAQLRQSDILGTSNSQADEVERTRIMTELNQFKEERDDCRGQLSSLEQQQSRVSEAHKALDAAYKTLAAKIKEEKSKKHKLTQNVTAAQMVLATKQKKADPRKMIPKHKAALEALKQNVAAKMEELAESYRDLLGFRKDHFINSAAYKELSSQLANLSQAKKDADNNVEVMKSRVVHMKQIMKGDKAKMRGLQESLENFLIENGLGPLTPELKEKLDNLPSDPNEIGRLIDEKQNEVEAIHTANPGAVAEFQQRKSQIDELQTRMKTDLDQLESQRLKIESMKEQWLPELRKTVEQINLKYQECFRKIDCVGEVLLHEEQSDLCSILDFEKFAIHIRVKYRAAEELQLLDQHRQSGGERSVATILYLISLQNVTVCPFRVVDEINQGMDQINERKCFMQLVEASCQPNTPQCFLLTPKLLPNLPYTEFITLLQIFNGTTIKEAAKHWTLGDVLGSRPMVAAF